MEMQQGTQVSLIGYVEVPALGKALNQVHIKGTHVILGWLHQKQFLFMLEILCAVESIKWFLRPSDISQTFDSLCRMWTILLLHFDYKS